MQRPTGETPPPVVEPWDAYNRALVDNVHPAAWVPPVATGRYNLVVLGAGTAGLVTAVGAVGLGAKVALIERDLMGGDCLNVGCVPSKALLRAARAAEDVRAAPGFGVKGASDRHVDFPAVMERMQMRSIRTQVSRADSAWRYRELGVDVFFGAGSFAGPDTVAVAGQTLRFKRAVIATGARAAVPRIPGLADVGYLTNETVFTLTALPRRLAVIGAGPVGCELAQAFARFGADVTMIQRGHQVLPRDDPDGAACVTRALTRDGIRLIVDAEIIAADRRNGDKMVHIKAGGVQSTIGVDEILLGVGRAPNVDGLGLERVGVAYDALHGVQVNDRLQTTNPRIYAAGDVCSPSKFTHNSDFQARIVVQNALFMGRVRVSALTLPWCIYTDPEVAHVGLSTREAKRRGIRLRTLSKDWGTSTARSLMASRRASSKSMCVTVRTGLSGPSLWPAMPGRCCPSWCSRSPTGWPGEDRTDDSLLSHAGRGDPQAWRCVQSDEAETPGEATPRGMAPLDPLGRDRVTGSVLKDNAMASRVGAETTLEIESLDSSARMAKVVRSAERGCVIMQTLPKPVPVTGRRSATASRS